MGIQLNKINNVQKIEFVAKEDAWAEQIATMDEAQAEFFTETTDEIPLPDAYKVTVKDLTKFSNTVKKIKKLDHVYTVRQTPTLQRSLQSFLTV